MKGEFQSPKVSLSNDYAVAREALKKGTANEKEQRLLYRQLEATEKAILALRTANPMGW